jgi:prevent-host-death family protein
MEICITNARGRLKELIRQAQAGDDIVLTRKGVAVARLTPIFRQSPMDIADDRAPDAPDPRSIHSVPLVAEYHSQHIGACHNSGAKS